MAHTFAAEADFFSIGTNDLTQYTLAMDRGHPKLAPKVDALNPAVLRLIAQTMEGAHAHQRLVGICGGVAGDPHAVPILVGLGVDELSVSLPAIPTVKAQIRRLSLRALAATSRSALSQCATAEEVRALVPEIRRLIMFNFKTAFSLLQKIGKCMMLPVSVLPVAGILLGVGSANSRGCPRASRRSWRNPATRFSAICRCFSPSASPLA